MSLLVRQRRDVQDQREILRASHGGLSTTAASSLKQSMAGAPLVFRQVARLVSFFKKGLAANDFVYEGTTAYAIMLKVFLADDDDGIHRGLDVVDAVEKEPCGAHELRSVKISARRAWGQ